MHVQLCVINIANSRAQNRMEVHTVYTDDHIFSIALHLVHFQDYLESLQPTLLLIIEGQALSHEPLVGAFQPWKVEPPR